MRIVVKSLLLIACCTPVFPAFADRNDEPAVQSAIAKNAFVLDAIVDENRTVFVGERGHILYRDAGASELKQAEVPVRVTLTSIEEVGASTYYVVGHDGIALTSNNAQTWDFLVKPSDLVARAADEVERRLAEIGDEPESEEAQSAWDMLDFMQFSLEANVETGAGNSLFDIHMREDGLGLLVGATGWAFLTRDKGANWEFISPKLDNPDLFHLYSAASLPSGTLIISGEAGLLFRSDDNAATWTRIETPYEGTILNSFVTGRDGEILLLGMGGKLLYSSDDGVSWRIIELPVRTVLEGAGGTPDGAILLVGLGGRVMRLKDGVVSEVPFPGRFHLAAVACSQDVCEVGGEGGIYALAYPPKDSSVKSEEVLRWWR